MHAGFAITTVDEAETQRTLDVLRAMAGAVESGSGEPLPHARPCRDGPAPASGPFGPGREAPAHDPFEDEL
ncbi:hypothetical protein [Streptomyces sp. A475]|uniref:hypothetical protein n=1 Tax=Streptomyces sp. A475 TaxID=3131976 RepID=UPI0030ED0D71